jgi:hypothetical protein
MIGGGFVGQMHQTNKMNRELVKNTTRRILEQPYYNRDEKRTETTVHLKSMTNEERLYWKKKSQIRRIAENAKDIVILVTSIVVTAILFFLLYAGFLMDL